MNKKALIFGVTGQDGSHLADLLLDKGYQVVGVTRRTSTDNTQRIKHLFTNSNFKIICGDITDSSSVFNILRDCNPDEVYNLAAQSHVGVSFKQPGLTWDITGKGCMNILQAMVDIGSKARFYQASSSEMFGDSYDIDGKYNAYQDEDTRFLPQSPYAIAKCAAHYATRLYREAYGIHASCGILFNHEGPRRGETFVTRKITKWIGEFKKWQDGLSPEIKVNGLQNCNKTDVLFYQSSDGTTRSYPKLRLGNLEASRDWGCAIDFVEAMWMMLQQDKPDDYVICTGESYTIKDFIEKAFGHVGIQDWGKYITIDMEFFRPAEVNYLRGECSKAKNKLGWKPKHSFDDLVEMMVNNDLK